MRTSRPTVEKPPARADDTTLVVAGRQKNRRRSDATIACA
jgi:hypothetical protein